MLVEKLKQKIVKDILIFQNEEHLEETEIRQEVDSDFFDIEHVLAEFDESEIKEEVESSECSESEERGVKHSPFTDL